MTKVSCGPHALPLHCKEDELLCIGPTMPHSFTDNAVTSVNICNRNREIAEPTENGVVLIPLDLFIGRFLPVHSGASKLSKSDNEAQVVGQALPKTINRQIGRRDPQQAT